jgi:AcrR family transcriptional regulator
VARKPASVRRQDLVEAGLRVIAREGMHGATVRRIVAEAGVPLATFHYVFASREEMIGEAYAYVALPADADEPLALPEGATLQQAVRAVLQAWFARFAEHPEYELAVMEIMAFCTRTPALAHLPGQVQERYLEVVAGILQQVVAHFDLSPAVPLREVATDVLHITDGLTYAWLRTHDTDASQRWIDAVAPTVVATLEGAR